MLLKKMTLQRGAVEAFNTRCMELRNTSLVLHWSGTLHLSCPLSLSVACFLHLSFPDWAAAHMRSLRNGWATNYICSAKASISVPDRRDLPQGCTSFSQLCGHPSCCVETIFVTITRLTSRHECSSRLRSVFTESQEPSGFCTCRPVEMHQSLAMASFCTAGTLSDATL